MPMHLQILPFLTPFALLALGPVAAAQQQPARADAEAHATARGGESTSSTHRVVVVNGKTVVDERTENGKPAARGGATPMPVPPMPPLPNGESAEEMLRRLQDELRRQLEQQGLPPLPQPPVPPPTPPTRDQPGRGKPVPRRA